MVYVFHCRIVSLSPYLIIIPCPASLLFLSVSRLTIVPSIFQPFFQPLWTLTFCSINHCCISVTRNRCSRPIYSELWVSADRLQERTDSLESFELCGATPVAFTALRSPKPRFPLTELAFRPSSAPMLNSLGARPFWQAVNFQSPLCSSCLPSVYSTVLRVLIVTSAGRNPGPWCH